MIQVKKTYKAPNFILFFHEGNIVVSSLTVLIICFCSASPVHTAKIQPQEVSQYYSIYFLCEVSEDKEKVFSKCKKEKEKKKKRKENREKKTTAGQNCPYSLCCEAFCIFCYSAGVTRTHLCSSTYCQMGHIHKEATFEENNIWEHYIQ